MDALDLAERLGEVDSFDGLEVLNGSLGPSVPQSFFLGGWKGVVKGAGGIQTFCR